MMKKKQKRQLKKKAIIGKKNCLLKISSFENNFQQKETTENLFNAKVYQIKFLNQ